MKFILFVEGQTEYASIAEFLKRWLDPQLGNRVGIQTVKFDGWGDLARTMASKARSYLESPKQSEIIAVVGLLDLYGLTIFPSGVTAVQQRYTWAKQFFESQVNDPRFRMFFAVHEFEAWLLSQTDIFPSEVRIALAGRTAHPERINFNEPPAKLLNRIYMQKFNRSYKKTTHGKQFFGKLDPTIAVGKCPYLKLMLADMLQLSQAAGL